MDKNISVREYLESFRTLKNKSKEMKREVELLKENIGDIKAVSYDRVNVQSSGVTSTLEESIINLQSKIEEISAIQERLAYEMMEIIDMINTLEHPAHIEVISKRYLHGKKWSKIIREMNYGDAQVYRFHVEALEFLEKKFKT